MTARKIDFEISTGGRLTSDLKEDEIKEAVDKAIDKFTHLDFGKVPTVDRLSNLEDLKAWTGRALGRYDSPRGDLYIIGYPVADSDVVQTSVIYVSDY